MQNVTVIYSMQIANLITAYFQDIPIDVNEEGLPYCWSLAGVKVYISQWLCRHMPHVSAGGCSRLLCPISLPIGAGVGGSPAGPADRGGA